MGKFRTGVFTVGAAKAFGDLQLARDRASSGGGSFGGAAGGGGAGGAGPALGSAQETALVVQRKVGCGGKTRSPFVLGATQHLRPRESQRSLGGRHPPYAGTLLYCGMHEQYAPYMLIIA